MSTKLLRVEAAENVVRVRETSALLRQRRLNDGGRIGSARAPAGTERDQQHDDRGPGGKRATSGGLVHGRVWPAGVCFVNRAQR